MENRANYILVGVFTLAILALSFGFVYWSANVSDSNTRVPLVVRIEGSVSGLSQGSQVLFNGLNVGTVTNLRIDPNDPRTVIATTQVDRTTPITTSTEASIGFQGLTGIGFIGLAGGNANERNIIQSALEQGATPVIRANPSDVTDILATARDISDRANNILGEFERLVLEVGPAVTTTANNIARTSANVDVFTASLAANSDQIEDFVASLGRLAESANGVALELPGLIDEASNFIGALNSQSINESIENVATITTALRDQTPNIAAAIQSVSNAAQGFGSFGATLSENSDEIDQFIGGLGPLTTTANSVATRLDTALGSAQGVIDAVDSAAIGRSVENVAVITDAVRQQTPAIATAIESVSSAAQGFGSFGQTLADNSGEIDQFIGGLGPLTTTANSVATRLDAALGSAQVVIDAVDPQQVGQTLDNLSGITQALRDETPTLVAAIDAASTTIRSFGAVGDAINGNLDAVRSFLAALGPISQSATSVAARLDTTLESVESISRSIDTANIDRAVDNIADFTQTLRDQNETIARAITSIADAADSFGVFGQSVRQNLGGIGQFLAALGPVSETATSAATRLDATLQSAQEIADAVDPAQVRTTVDSVAGLSSALNARSGEIQSVISGTETVVATFNTALTGLNGTRARIDEILLGIDAAAVGQAVDNVSSATTNIARAADAVGGVARDIGARRDDIDAIITNVEETSANLRTASAQVQGLINTTDSFLNGPEGDGLSSEARQTLQAIRAAAVAVQAGIAPISSSVVNLSDQGLREVQSLVRDTTGSISRVERAITDLANNPSRVITGGGGTGGVRQFDGRARR